MKLNPDHFIVHTETHDLSTEQNVKHIAKEFVDLRRKI